MDSVRGQVAVFVMGVVCSVPAAFGTWTPTSTLTAAQGVPESVLFGAYVDPMMTDPRSLDRFEQLVHARTRVASYYYGYGDVFPGPLERRFADRGRRRILVSWHLDVARYGAWARGRHDRYLAQVAAAAAAYPRVIYVRPWAEMNGDWHEFQPTAEGDKRYGGTYRQFKSAWRHVVTYMRRHGATNIRWVFNPAADVYPGTTPVRAIWPGERYVDVLGIDGYNWGRDSGWGRWRSYRRIFTPMYQRLTRLHTTAPVWICEFGSKEPQADDGAPVDRGHSKATWIRNAFSYRGFPRVRAMVYFHVRKERDWRLNSSQQALAATRRALGRF